MSPAAAVAPPLDLDAAVLLKVIADVEGGDFSVRLPLTWTGLAGKVADRLNNVIASNEALARELARMSRVVGKEGRLSQRAGLGALERGWADSVTSVNELIDDLVRPIQETQRVIGAVADGDLTRKISVDVSGDVLDLKNATNVMVDRLSGFVSEVTRVARDVGTEGRLGQAAVTNEVAGVWKDLTESINLMAGNLTEQVRNIAEVTTAVANGDLSKKITADVKGEFLELKITVNAMVDQLNSFAGEVTRVAREVGVEGKLGGQAQSKEVAGVWKDLTDNVNQLAANLTNQVRAIADVATAVTAGDLTRQVGVEARGEVAALKDSLNEMIRNLHETTRVNTEQDWLKTHLERFARMLQGQRDLATVSTMILSELAPVVSAQHGAFFAMTSLEDGGEPVLQFQAGYGYKERKHLLRYVRVGEGLVGQCAREKQVILLSEVPDDYIKVNSGLGEAKPLNIIVLPILFEGSVRAVIELASFSRFSAAHQAFLDRLAESIGLVLNTIETNTLTENLLKQSQSQAQELRSQQEELRTTNEDLAAQAHQLEEQNQDVERKNVEVEAAKLMVEEKAEQLAVSSKYKSEFLANMSHELRTPLNSLLILAEDLELNGGGNLTAKQVEYATHIRSAGSDLLDILNGILDLAKAESGTMTVETTNVSLTDLCQELLDDFKHVAARKGLAYRVEFASSLPPAMRTDGQRLRQVLKNLLSNAFKFTDAGEVVVTAGLATDGWDTHSVLDAAPAVIAFTVTDTGIGVAADDQRAIFEAFAQVDGTTARRFGGTGLGLSISREFVGLLGGAITITSTPGAGSTFTAYFPLVASGRSIADRSGSDAVAIDVPARALAVASAAIPPARVSTNGHSHAPALPAVTKAAPDRGLSYRNRLAGLHVLVVDDDFRNIFALTALLERGGLNVSSAESGKAGIAALAEDPDVYFVLMDIMMPGLDGYETMRLIRERPEYKDLVIIAVTAKVDIGERERCIAAGATAYIPKPVDTAALMNDLTRWLPDEPGERT
jgi:signal transduction histidine kinase/CheY-like chemotaxis protein/HAMP domain-containing protein